MTSYKYSRFAKLPFESHYAYTREQKKAINELGPEKIRENQDKLLESAKRREKAIYKWKTQTYTALSLLF